MSMNSARELAALQRLTVPQLRARYAEIFGETTNANNRLCLVKQIAWRLQAPPHQGARQMKPPQRSPTLALVRCAIYTRKSTEEGLEQEFNSLDAQRESGQAYIQSQQHEGWVCLPDRYDDGGFTGGNTERPALQRLLADIAAGKVDCVVISQIHRLSRSPLHFAQTVH